MFTSDDMKKYNCFKRVVFSGEFSIKGDAGSAVGSLFKWFDDLGLEIEKQVEQEGKILSVKIKEGELNADS
jgi:hypothetical protein